MARFDLWRADRFTFAVAGQGAQAFFTQAAGQGIPLYRVRCACNGYTAGAHGRDHARLQALAEAGGWHFTVLARHGAGRFAAALLHRPGLPLGALLCAALLRVLSGYVWSIDFAGLDSDRQQNLRTLLDANGIREGSHLTQSDLLQAQQALTLHSEEYGWLSLNFTGGCLFVETAARERQSIQPEPVDTALYAKAGGEVLAVEVDSGFAAVQPGQYVAAGQLLVAAVRPDHSGGPVTQAAGGRVLARVELEVTAAQPLQVQAPVLTGRHTAQSTLCLLGRQLTLHAPEREYQTPQTRESWLPLRLGRVCLPASVHTCTHWEQRECELIYSEQTAAALARRACRLQLAAQFPDAVVETQAARTEIRDGQAVCSVRYVFVADIAAAQPDRGEMAP